MFQHHASAEKTEKQLSYMHKNLCFILSKESLTLPTHTTFLEVSSKNHMEHLHQNMVDISNVIVQVHGRQKVMLMPPISEQYPPYPHLLDSIGHSFLNKEIDLSTSDMYIKQRITACTYNTLFRSS